MYAPRRIPSHVAMHVNMREYIRTCTTGITYLHTDPEAGAKMEEEMRCKYVLKIEILKPK